MGIGSIKSAYEFRQYFTNGVIAAGRTSKDLAIDRSLNSVIPPVLFCLAFIGWVVCLLCVGASVLAIIVGGLSSIGIMDGPFPWFGFIDADNRSNHTMHILLWVLQVLAAGSLYTASGVMKVFMFDR